MNLQQLLTDGGGLLLVIVTVVQIAPVKINPWSWLAKAIGRAINADVSKRLDGIEKKIDGHVSMDDRRTADGHRARILHFNNELLRSIDHTKEEFIEILLEIDLYEKYCREHPNYPNNRAVMAIGNIKRVYEERMQKHDFLDENGVRG